MSVDYLNSLRINPEILRRFSPSFRLLSKGYKRSYVPLARHRGIEGHLRIKNMSK